MANRESIMNALIELECKPTTYSRELLRKKWVEALTTAEFDPCDRLDGRTARKEISLYDAMYAEILGEKDAEKARVRNRRKADRKHPENKAERKKEKQNRMHRLYGLAYEDTKYGKTVYFWDKKEGQKKFPEYEAEIFRNLKERSAEKLARADWELEQDSIAEDAERDAIDAEIREWELKHAIEQANTRAWMAMQNWLEWA